MHFIEDPDGGTHAIECDFWIDDCPRGEKCMPWADDGNSWNAWRCFPLEPDPAQVGEPCTVQGNGVSGIDDCAERSMCWQVDPETNTGFCVGFCSGSRLNPTCPDGLSCVITSGPLILCLPICDPLFQDCFEGGGCYAVAGSFDCMIDASGDAGSPGDPCASANACDPGSICEDASVVPGCTDDECCTPACDLTDPLADTACEAAVAGSACVPFYARGQAPAGFQDVGFCGQPL